MCNRKEIYLCFFSSFQVNILVVYNATLPFYFTLNVFISFFFQQMQTAVFSENAFMNLLYTSC